MAHEVFAHSVSLTLYSGKENSDVTLRGLRSNTRWKVFE